MPNHIAHNEFYFDVYSNLPVKMKKEQRYNWKRYKTFGQGHDMVYSYCLAAPHKAIINYKRLPELRDNNIQLLALNYIKHLYESKQIDETKLFLYGYLIHHFFDAKIHPFIIYQTGDYLNSGEYRSYHAILENMIDASILKKQGINPIFYLIHHTVSSNEKLTEDTRTVIRESFQETYGYEKFDKAFHNYNINFKNWLMLFYHDPWGIKNFSTKPFSGLLKGFRAHRIRFNGTEADQYLNHERNEWNNPANKDDVSNSSYDDLYEEALMEVSQMIARLEEAIDDKANENEIKTIIPNISSTHGYEDPTLKLQYAKENINIRRK